MLKQTILLHLPTLFGVGIEVYLILVVIAALTFFSWRWLLKKFIKDNKTRKIATWIATLVASPLIYVGLILLWFASMSYHPKHEFNQDKWLADKDKRYELSEDLIETKMLIGKTKSEVRQILGAENNTERSDHWTYELGFRPGFANIDPDVLEIEFKDGIVIKVEQHGT